MQKSSAAAPGGTNDSSSAPSSYAGAAMPQLRPPGTQNSTSSARAAAPLDIASSLSSSSVRTSEVVEGGGDSAPVLSVNVGSAGLSTSSSVPTSPVRTQTSPSSFEASNADASITQSLSGDGSAVSAGPSVTGTTVTHTQTPALASTTVGGVASTPEAMSPEHGPIQSPVPPPSGRGVVLGVQALERQQAELELKRRQQAVTPLRLAPTPHQTPAMPQRQAPIPTHAIIQHNPFEDDETTERSSMTGSGGDHGELEVHPSGRARSNSIGRLIRSTRKRLSSSEGRPELDRRGNSYDSDDELVEEGSRPIIYGYLLKLGRNGKWQRRFFETDGECLSYYKTIRRTKLLATLDLMKVGQIAVDDTDSTGCTFTIQVSDRPYNLRAENSGTCKDWVITLNRIKEARMHIGNVELVTPKFHHPPDLLDRSRTQSEEYAARVVVNANRQRTRAVDESIRSWDQLVANGGKPPDFLTNSPVTLTQPGVSPERPPKRIISHLPPQVMARWKKRRSVVYSMGRRIVRWARRMRELRCIGSEDDIHLDQRVHPPGHNDPMPSSYAPKTVSVMSKDSTDGVDSGGASVGSGSLSPSHRHENMSYTEWIGKEAQISTQSVSQKETIVDDDDASEGRELS